jgi:hypothetical protein
VTTVPDDLSALPVSSQDVDGLEQSAGQVASTGELALIALVSSAVVAEITGDDGGKFSRFNRFRHQARRIVTDLVQRAQVTVNAAVNTAKGIGEKTATTSIARTTTRLAAAIPPAEPAHPLLGLPLPNEVRHALGLPQTLDSIRATAPVGPTGRTGVTVRAPHAALPALHEIAPQLLASTEGMYQHVMAEVMANPVLSEQDRLVLAQKVLNKYARNGITAHIDTGKRRWSTTSYVEMLTRTATAQAAMDAHVHVLSAAGFDLVRVSVHANCSNLCAPFQGHLLSVTGTTTSSGPETWRDRVVCSLPQARARGFNHPNCKHFVVLWVPGDPLPDAPEVDPADYAATQHLRYLERRVRASKRLAAAAITRRDKRVHAARTRELQQRIRDHVAAHPTVVRKRHRERIGVPQ